MQNHPTYPPLDPQRFSPTFKERFWSKVSIGDNCWLWVAGLDEGYGSFTRGRDGVKGRIRAHVASWTLHYGPVPIGFFVLHHCDNRPCIRPDHLFLGTQADNVLDMISKNRAVHPCGINLGETNKNSKLSARDVLEIRSLYRSGRSAYAIAPLFKIHSTTVYQIVRNRTWLHIHE